MAGFLLVSGAWHGGWCWERVVPLLEAAGHRALAPDLLGMGGDATPLAEVSLAGWADQIAALATAQAEPVILVGHSRGGIVISEVAERVPDRIATLAYLAAFLVPSGETLLAMTAKMPGDGALDILAQRPDGTTTVRPGAIGPTFYNLTEPRWLARATGLLGPEPMAAFLTPLALTRECYGTVPRAYIECTQDQAVPLALQRAMQAELPCDPVFTLESDHSPFYSDPEALVACLATLAKASR